ncbi:MAG: O-linked N-acetylglucosamine transferase, SPINDLY family protein [Cyanobacteriota bacterium]
MSVQSSTKFSGQWQEQGYQLLLGGSYDRAATLYEQAIAAEPGVKSHYWYLGLALLLQGQEAQAQTTWLMGLMEGEPSQVEEWTEELKQVLQAEATRREDLGENAVTETIRQHIRELDSTNVDNLLHLVQLAIKQKTYTGDELNDLGIIELLQSEPLVDVDLELLLDVLQDVLDSAPWHTSSVQLAKACLPYIHSETTCRVFLNTLLRAGVDIGYAQKQPGVAVQLLELGVRLDAKNTEFLRHLATCYQNSEQYEQGIETAKLLYSLLESLPDKATANHVILRGLMSAGGHWQEADAACQQQETLLTSLLEERPIPLDSLTISRLLNSNYFVPYFRDEPKEFRQLQNQLAEFCQANTEIQAKEKIEKYRQRHFERQGRGVSQKPLKIGYLSYCLRQHSVGWLARWLFRHHDRERFQIYAYFVACNPVYDPLHEWYLSQVDQAYNLTSKEEIAEQIFQDEIDILIDLDSLTLDVSYQVVALKPAPIQVTWLGWDASGIPTVDYFIADPYVLPDSAQEYYSEKIWRLPQTYIAVDGFEVDVPTLRREELDIESDAVVYLSAQRGFKRNPETARLQMKIIKEVPNSYFLIKGGADEAAIKSLFTQIAQEEGVESDRLRFLKGDLTESIHRANLGIADVVLDTFPYNGATTTLETLWMCIPLVTRVGEQFAARNSYTMMLNAGITEGIAWTDEEYIQWGVRLGKDEALRQTISWKLRQSRKTAPLWNGKQFTREMEKAYEQMWQRYAEESG